jgi:ATP-dependent DNA helicase RecQ
MTGPARGGGGGDQQLLSMLKDLRRDVARKLRLQPWVIFGDPSLEDMSIMYPITVEELKNCQGVGEGKARKFGKEFLELIERYVEENEITRPDDFVMKSTVNKSVNKVFIIQSIDRKFPLEDIADAKGMDMEELLDEIEAIVYSGTKLNLDYYIEQTLDEDVVDEIFEYFRDEAESDSLESAMEELGNDYDEVEVRLVRIKFLCEVAN